MAVFGQLPSLREASLVLVCLHGSAMCRLAPDVAPDVASLQGLAQIWSGGGNKTGVGPGVGPG